MNQDTSKPLSIVVSDKDVLQAAYMPYIKDGGLFIPTNKKYKMGQSVSLVVSLMNEPKKYKTAGKVVWVTPVDAHGNKTPGIGVKFEDYDEVDDSNGNNISEGFLLRQKIETLLVGRLQNDKRTHTM